VFMALEQWSKWPKVDPKKVDYHVHLYGCLSPQQIQSLVHKIGLIDTKGLRFLDFYEEQYGQRPDWQSLFEPSNIAELRQHYLFLKAEPFARFQAKINLPVVAFPYSVSKYVLEEALLKDRHELHAIEYRTFFPHDLDDVAYADYVLAMVEMLMKYEDTSAPFLPRLIVSMDRSPSRHFGQLGQLMYAMRTYPQIEPYIVGIDFCGFETSPLQLEAITQKIRSHSELEVCVHVGEQIHEQYILHSIRWVYEAARMGAHRLGHALALGYPLNLKKGQPIVESVEQQAENRQWLENNKAWLAESGYVPIDHDGVYTDDIIANLTQLQEILMDKFPQDVAIEVCPTSNLRIGGLGSMAEHPVRRFYKHGLKVLVGSDDPGMFDTSLTQEHKLLDKVNGLSC
jgi:hypothetical protein